MSRRLTVSRKVPSSFPSQAKSLHSRSAASLLLGLTAQAVVGGMSGTAFAAEWLITPSIEVGQAVTDNARHAPRGAEESDTYTSVTPAISLSAEGARLRLNLDYAVTGRHYYSDDDLDNLQHYLLGGGNMTLVPEKLFIDARASISQQVVDPTGPLTANPNGDTSNPNSRSVRTYSVSPYLTNRLGSFADSTLRYTWSQFSAQGGLGTTTTNAISETLTSGPDFTRLAWVATLQASESKASDVDAGAETTVFGGPAHDSSRYLAVFAPEYAVNRYLHLLGSIGYEKIEDETLLNEPDGPIASAGVRVQPGPRSVFRVMLNHRYDDTYVTGDGSYLIGPTSRVDAAYTRDIQTTQSLYAENLSYLGNDDYGNFIDTRSLQRFQLDNSAFGVSNTAFLEERYSLRFTTDLERDSFYAEAYRIQRESQNVMAATQTTNGINFTWTRPLSPIMTFALSLDYYQSEYSGLLDNGDSREDHVWTGGPGISYQFNETLTGTLNYDFLYRNSNAAQGDLRENIISVSLRKLF